MVAGFGSASPQSDQSGAFPSKKEELTGSCHVRQRRGHYRETSSGNLHHRPTRPAPTSIILNAVGWVIRPIC